MTSASKTFSTSQCHQSSAGYRDLCGGLERRYLATKILGQHYLICYSVIIMDNNGIICTVCICIFNYDYNHIDMHRHIFSLCPTIS